MTKGTFVAVLAFGLLFSAHRAQADMCGDMGRLAGQWAELGRYIDVNAGDGLSPPEVQYISRYEKRLLVPTIRIVGAAANGQRPQVRDVAVRLAGDLRHLDEIDDDDDWTEDARVISHIARELGKLTGICRGQAQ